MTRRLGLATLLFLFPSVASATLPEKAAAWLKSNNIDVPDWITPAQQQAVVGLIDRGCAAGTKVSAPAMNGCGDSEDFTCTGDKAKDVSAYLHLPIQVAPTDVLTPATFAWLKTNKIVLTECMYRNQLVGLRWLVTHEWKAGPIKVGGIEFDATGDKVADVNQYLDLVAATNFSAGFKSEDEKRDFGNLLQKMVDSTGVVATPTGGTP